MKQSVPRRIYLCASVFICGLLFFLTSCTAHKNSDEKVYSVRGIVKQVDPAKKSVTVQHEKIPGYMDAMTMPFDVKNTNELRGLTPGDRIAFQMVVNKTNGWIQHIIKLDRSPEELPSRSTVQIARAVDSLDIGQTVPDFHLTNELGQPVTLSGLKGQAVAITFFFTRCPFPNFCPRMNNNFAETEDKLLQQKGASTNWQLLSISFDPENDTPEHLLQYAKSENYNPAHWHFLTGSDAEISQLCEAFDEKYWHDQGTISHNLRTVVIDTKGRLQKIFEGNDWTPDQLVQELLKACKSNR